MPLPRRTLVVAAAGFVAALGCGGAGPRKPLLPAARDPGGMAVALIGAGLDYTRPGIARRLARDGEGEAIALAAGDARPFADPAEPATALASIVIEEAQAARLVPVRMPAGAPSGIVPALRFVAQTPARAAGIAPPPPIPPVPLDRLSEVAARVPHLLLVIGARHLGGSDLARPNVLVVTAAGETGPATPLPPVRADVAVALASPTGSTTEAARRAGALPDDIAMARVLALAARLAASKPGLDGAALKAHLLELAEPDPDAGPHAATHGRLPDVARIYPPE